jgi:hypothetical protein
MSASNSSEMEDQIVMAFSDAMKNPIKQFILIAQSVLKLGDSQGKTLRG